MGFIIIGLYVLWLVSLTKKAKEPIVSKPYINHPLHVVLSFLTVGFWLFVYVPLLMLHGSLQKRYLAGRGQL